jgi:hypothetical protein
VLLLFSRPRFFLQPLFFVAFSVQEDNTIRSILNAPGRGEIMEAGAGQPFKEAAEHETSPVEVDPEAHPQARSGAFFFFGSAAEVGLIVIYATHPSIQETFPISHRLLHMPSEAPTGRCTSLLRCCLLAHVAPAHLYKCALPLQTLNDAVCLAYLQRAIAEGFLEVKVGKYAFGIA